MSKHTPGPWAPELVIRDYSDTGEYEGSYKINGPDGEELLELAWNDTAEDNANAWLIASAPELLEALETMVAMFSNSIQIDGYVGPAIKQARAAIAKAKGEQQSAEGSNIGGNASSKYIARNCGNSWGVQRITTIGTYTIEAFHATNIPNREAAERIAAIYEEVQP